MSIHFLFDINRIIFFLCYCVKKLTICDTIPFLFSFLGWFFFNLRHLVHSGNSFEEMINVFWWIFLFWNSLEIIFARILIVFFTATLIYLFLFLVPFMLWFFIISIVFLIYFFLSLLSFLWVFPRLLFNCFLLELEFD